MLFSGLVFLCIFFPLTMVVYNVAKDIRVKNIVLLTASLIFYAWGEPKWIFVMIFTSFADYVFGLLIDKYRGVRLSKIFLITSIVITLGVLAVFKYMNFFTHNLNLLPFINVHETHITLPIGISFYTFQAMSYVVDVYRGDVEVQKKYSRLLLYVSMFPQLIAGPIVRYSTISLQLEKRKAPLEQISAGITRFCIGLAKKVILANYLGLLVETAFGEETLSVTALGAWTGLFAYFFQIYFDFSGYSDMAIGMGKMLGFDFEENFNYPYTAKSITDFWRRWHISLGSFFRDYVYIPLGGNRKHQMRNMFIVWALTGFWHGASWNFLIWGIYYFALLALEKNYLKQKFETLPVVVSRVYTLFFVGIGWLIFYFEDTSKLFAAFKALLGIGTNGTLGADAVMFKNNLLLFAVCIIASTPVAKIINRIINRLRAGVYGTIAVNFITVIFQCAMIFICVACLVGSTYNPFLYFRF